jgi:hypothetical protein
MAALVLGHSFVRRLKLWMVDNGLEMSVRNHEVHLHGVGRRVIRRVYDRDFVEPGDRISALLTRVIYFTKRIMKKSKLPLDTVTNKSITIHQNQRHYT